MRETEMTTGFIPLVIGLSFLFTSVALESLLSDLGMHHAGIEAVALAAFIAIIIGLLITRRRS